MPIRFKTLVKVVVAITILFALTSFSLVKTHNRTLTHHLPKRLIEQVNRQTRGMTEMQIMNYSLDLTAKSLKFAEKNDIEYGKANCVGYAQLCSAICNQALKNNGYSYRAKPVVGYITDYGINLCTLFKSVAPTRHWKNFVKDHDFVELQLGKTTYYFDPSVYDILGDKCLTIKNSIK